MITTKGKVVKINDGAVYVVAEKKPACASCGEKSVCGVSTLGKIFGNKRSLIRIETPDDSKVGDEVEISIVEKDLLKIAARSYVAPLAGFFIFAILGTFLKNAWSFGSDAPVVAFALFGMLLSWFWLRTKADEPLAKLVTATGQQVKFNKERLNEKF